MYRTDTEHTLTAGLGMADLNIPGWPQTTDGTPLVARCLLLDDGSTRLAIVSLTVIALRRAEALLVREAVANASDTPANHVMVACTHVHSGPPTFTGDPDVRSTAAKAIAAASADAARQAADVQPARLGVSTGQLAGVSRVRRVLRHDGSVITLRRAWPEYWDWATDPETVGPEDPLDDLLTVLRIENADGEPIGVLFHFTCHPIPDFFGYAAQAVESALPGSVCLILNGCQGSVDTPFEVPLEGKTQQEQLPILGDALTKAALELLGRAECSGHVPLGVCSRDVFLPLDVRTPESTSWRDREMWADAFTAGGFSTEVQCMRIGDLALAGIPGEAQVGFGAQIAGVSPFSITRGVGLANDECAYLLDVESRARGGYEADPETWGVVSGEGLPRILEAIEGCLEELNRQHRR
ncbi:MAG TPA: hypothetical protein DGT21_13880 [Armatimonadetes bacterium]|nr:hypothetical protein [Armatimonadota bacterium]